MKNKIVVLIFSALFLVGCSKKDEVTLDTDEITVSETGEFQITGNSKKNSSFYINDQIITSKEQDKNGKYTVRVKMGIPEESANFKIKYLNDELLNRKIKFNTTDFENNLKAATEQATKDSIELETQKSIAKEEKENQREDKIKKRKEDSDITKMSETPTLEQEEVLDRLAKQQFEAEFPYKGSKMHTFKGVIQKWTMTDNKWYYKVEATIVNEYGAKKDSNLEVHITPISEDSGSVELVSY